MPSQPAWQKSPKADKIWCAPGNAGIAEYAECVDIGAMEFDKLAAFAKENRVGPVHRRHGRPAGGRPGGRYGRGRHPHLRTEEERGDPGRIKGIFKDLMKKYNIPTAAYENFTDRMRRSPIWRWRSSRSSSKRTDLPSGKGADLPEPLKRQKKA